ncbi:reverse transcriptase domain-containing protein [Tanacetum coccineum]
MGNNNKIALARFRIANLEQIIKEIQVRHQADKESLVGNSLLRDDITELPFRRELLDYPLGLSFLMRTELVFSRSNCTEDCKVKFATGPEDGRRILPYDLKGTALKTYVRRFRILATLCLTMVVPDLRENDRSISIERPCTVKCNTCNKVGHLTKNCKNKGPATGSNLLPVTVTCHAYGEKGHYANQYRKTTNNNAQGRAYMLRDMNAHQDPNIVTGIFLLNQHLARVLFDSGADKSFVSISLASMLNIPPITIDTFYNIEMLDGK